MGKQFNILCGAHTLQLLLLLGVQTVICNSCTIQKLLEQSGSTYTTTLSSTCILETNQNTVNLTKSWEVTSPVQSTLDLNFLRAVVGVPPGFTYGLSKLHLPGSKLLWQDLLWLELAVNYGGSLQLRELHLETDCATVFNYQQAAGLASSNPGNLQGDGWLYVEAFDSVRVSARKVNITCQLPLPMEVDNETVVPASSSLELLNAVAYVQTVGHRSSITTICLTSNITTVKRQWPLHDNILPQVLILHSMTIKGQTNTLTVLDFAAEVGFMEIRNPAASILFQHLYMINNNVISGALATRYGGGGTALFSAVFWAVAYDRNANISNYQLVFQGCTISLPKAEYDYLALWAVVVTTNVSAISSAGAALRAKFQMTQLGPSMRDHITFSRLAGLSMDLQSVSLTFLVPDGYSNLVYDNVVPVFGLPTSVADIFNVPCYDLADIMQTLEALEVEPKNTSLVVSLFIWRNITIDPAVWPKGGYKLRNHIVLLGRTFSFTWVNMSLIPNFISISDEFRLRFSSLVLLNLPSPEPVSSSQRRLLGQLAPEGTLKLPGLAYNRATWALSLNNTVMVVPYQEFKFFKQYAKGQPVPFYADVDRSDWVLEDEAVAPVRGVPDEHQLVLASARAYGWVAKNLTLTWMVPRDMAALLYNNVLDQESSRKRKLKGWEIGVIVACSVVGATLLAITALIFVRQQRLIASSTPTSKNSQVSVQQPISVDAQNSSPVCSGSDKPSGSPRLADNQIDVQVAGVAEHTDSSSRGNSRRQSDKMPHEELHSLIHVLTQEIQDQHLVILDVLGQGGFATVYKGLWKNLQVAVKTLTFQDKLVGGEKAQQRAMMEAAISSSLVHPNVVITYAYDIKPLRVESSDEGPGLKIQHSVVTDWKLYIIQEYCDGGSFRNAVVKKKFYDDRHQRPRLEMILDVTLEIAQGMEHLHSRNVIHGDLNPNNVLLKRDPSRKYGAICKIADFGLSVKMAADQSHISNMHRGTPFYTAPEVLSKGNMTKAADVFSFGVMLWECYNSCMSYRTHATNGFMPHEDFPKFTPSCPVQFSDLTQMCLDPEPGQRPTFTQVCQRLQDSMAQLKGLPGRQQQQQQ